MWGEAKDAYEGEAKNVGNEGGQDVQDVGRGKGLPADSQRQREPEGEASG